MDNLMRSAHLLATDPLFRAACRTDLKSALTRRGLDLTKVELKAFSRVRTLITNLVDGDWPPDVIDWWVECDRADQTDGCLLPATP